MARVAGLTRRRPTADREFHPALKVAYSIAFSIAESGAESEKIPALLMQIRLRLPSVIAGRAESTQKFFFGCRQGEQEVAAFGRALAQRPDATAVGFHDMLADG